MSQPTVLSVAYPFAAVTADSVGGAEQILSIVEAALVSCGMRSVVVAHAGSAIAGELLGVPVPEGLLTPEARAAVEAETQGALEAAIATNRPDLIHMHGIDFYRYALPHDLPVLVTLHLPPAWYPPAIWNLPRRYTLQCVSQSQKAACPAQVQERLVVVENGVPLPARPFLQAPREGFALLLSRICPEKNLHTAMDAAREAGLPLVLAGKVYPYPEHMAYFAQEIEPRLGPHARFIGPVGGAEKQRLLEHAQCLLVPSLAQETSSLVAMEALAAGTPVVAWRSGALPEIVQDGLTGFLVDTAAGMQSALGRLAEIDPRLCRRIAQQRFSSAAMIDRYLTLYEHILQQTQALQAMEGPQ